jgi:hypothetical protein
VGRIAQTSVLIAIAVLLAAILGTLVTIAWRGVRIEHVGAVSLDAITGGIPLEMAGPITLEMTAPVHLVTTGAESDAVPIDLSLPTCPECGGSLVPVRFNLWTGEIEWACPACSGTTDEER